MFSLSTKKMKTSFASVAKKKTYSDFSDPCTEVYPSPSQYRHPTVTLPLPYRPRPIPNRPDHPQPSRPSPAFPHRPQPYFIVLSYFNIILIYKGFYQIFWRK